MLRSREGGAAAAAQLHGSTARAPHAQQEVKVGRAVHGVKDVGVVRNQQLCKDRKHNLMKPQTQNSSLGLILVVGK